MISHTPAAALVGAASAAGQYRVGQDQFQQGLQSQHLALAAQGQALAAAEAQQRGAEQQAARQQQQELEQRRLDQQYILSQQQRGDYADRLQAQIEGKSNLQDSRDEAAMARTQYRTDAGTENQAANRDTRKYVVDATTGERYYRDDQQDVRGNRGLDQQEEYNTGRLDQGQQRIDVSPDHGAILDQRGTSLRYRADLEAWKGQRDAYLSDLKSLQHQQGQLLTQSKGAYGNNKAELIRQAQELAPRIQSIQQRLQEHAAKAPTLSAPPPSAAAPAPAYSPATGATDEDTTMADPSASLAPQDQAVAMAHAPAGPPPQPPEWAAPMQLGLDPTNSDNSVYSPTGADKTGEPGHSPRRPNLYQQPGPMVAAPPAPSPPIATPQELAHIAQMKAMGMTHQQIKAAILAGRQGG